MRVVGAWRDLMPDIVHIVLGDQFNDESYVYWAGMTKCRLVRTVAARDVLVYGLPPTCLFCIGGRGG